MCLLFSCSVPRAFKINELKAEVASHLAVLEKRVERECRGRVPRVAVL